jgi:hypothetical protein
MKAFGLFNKMKQKKNLKKKIKMAAPKKGHFPAPPILKSSIFFCENFMDWSLG